jgi:hypothetical protein
MARGNLYHERSIRQAAGLQCYNIANILAKHKPPDGRSPRTSPAAAPATFALLPLLSRPRLRDVHRLALQLRSVQARYCRLRLSFLRHFNKSETFGNAGELVLGKTHRRKLAERFEKRPKFRFGNITREISDEEIHCSYPDMSSFEDRRLPPPDLTVMLPLGCSLIQCTLTYTCIQTPTCLFFPFPRSSYRVEKDCTLFCGPIAVS